MRGRWTGAFLHRDEHLPTMDTLELFYVHLQEVDLFGRCSWWKSLGHAEEAVPDRLPPRFRQALDRLIRAHSRCDMLHNADYCFSSSARRSTTASHLDSVSRELSKHM